MNRRALLSGLLLAGVVPTVPGGWWDAASATNDAARPFSDTTVREAARALAARPFAAPDTRLPAPFSELGYDAYLAIHHDPGRALWRREEGPFRLVPHHRGFLYRHRVDLFEVSEGRARPIPYDPAAFALSHLGGRPTEGDIGHAGFRLTHPLNRPDHFDEVASFLGASYFRALGRGHAYGVSARGLAVSTAERGGEEFPIFRAFWIERPHPQGASAVVHALLDGPSASGAYRLTIRPGEATVFDVEARIYPRVDVATVGVAPLTSMFYFSPMSRRGADDFRGAVHDSDGLMLSTGRGEAIWRPLANPRELQVSAFLDVNPRGFGLMQRRRSFAEFQDLQARYERRPSLWVEPIGDWGEGAVHLVEIPTPSEMHDNVVASWRPRGALRAGQEYSFVYRLHWLSDLPPHGTARTAAPLASFASSRQGLHNNDLAARLFVLEAAGGRLAATEGPPVPEVAASAGRVRNPVVMPNPETGGWRLAFELVPGNERLVELRALLRDAQGPLTETWLYRWTA